MSFLTKEYILTKLKTILISFFFTIPFIFILINVSFFGNEFLIKTTLFFIITIFFSVSSFITIDLSDSTTKTKDKIVTVSVICITAIIVLLIF